MIPRPTLASWNTTFGAVVPGMQPFRQHCTVPYLVVFSMQSCYIFLWK